jgi:hypothetical protein
MENHPAAPTAGPEYFSRNGQQLVLGATSSPRPGHLKWHVTAFINSGICCYILIQPHWWFWQPISCHTASALAACSLQPSLSAPSGGLGGGAAILAQPSIIGTL